MKKNRGVFATMSDTFATSVIQAIATSFVGFVADMYSPPSTSETSQRPPIVSALVKEDRYIYLSLLGILLLIIVAALQV